MKHELNYMNFEKELKGKSAIVFYTAPNCSACKNLNLLINSILTQENISINRYEVNVEDNLFLAKSNGIQQTPTLVIYNNVQEIERIQSIDNKETIRYKLNKHLN